MMLNYPAAERNKEPILHVLKQVIPYPLDRPWFVLEVGSGSGQHVAHFAKHLGPNVVWQPTEVSRRCLDSIAAYIEAGTLTNVLRPLYLDCREDPSQWAGGMLAPSSYDVILCINMIHITPWSCTEGLFRLAGCLLRPEGYLLTYGPYAEGGRLSPESNVAFDRSLRQQDPSYGVRDVDDLSGLARENGMQLEQTVDMPSNNKTLIFRKLALATGNE